jgi:TetR/AcrR family transcriptional regulator, tetracycline repressor protein
MTVSVSSGRSKKTKRKTSPRPRGRPPFGEQPLSRALVLKQALALLDAEGLANLSMRVLAQRLGVSPMSLYNHVADKDGLLDALHEAVLLEALPARGFRVTTWKHTAAVIARTMRHGLQAHPNALTLFATRPMRAPALLRGVDAFLGCLLDAGFSPHTAIYLLDCIGMFTIGHAQAEFGTSPVAAPDRNGDDLVAELTSLKKQRLHHLTRVVTDTRSHNYDAEFEVGLAALLDGFELRLETVNRDRH